VTLHTSASIWKSSRSSSAAASASRRIVPLPTADALAVALGFANPIHPAQDPLARAVGERRLHVVLVHHRQVVEDVLLQCGHPV
jgi:hypothetical protein